MRVRDMTANLTPSRQYHHKVTELLESVRKDEQLLKKTPLSSLTFECLTYLQTSMLPLVSLIFLGVILTRLVLMKSLLLLEKPAKEPQEEELPTDFADKLIEYHRFRMLSRKLLSSVEEELRRKPMVLHWEFPATERQIASKRLLAIYKKALLKKDLDSSQYELILPHYMTVEDSITHITKHLEQSRNVAFQSLIPSAQNLPEICSLFMGVLQLAKDKKIFCTQKKGWDEIWITRRSDEN